jgi:DNA primase
MTNATTLFDLATQYHRALPGRLRAYLNNRGIGDPVIDRHLLGWNGWRITIPIFDREGSLAFFKFARDPDDPRASPKMLASPGSRVELYDWAEVLAGPQAIVICEGEFDRLVLETQGIPAVTSTGGAGTFRPEWAKEFGSIPDVYICFDRDEAGRRGARRVAALIPHAKIVELPEEVGEGGDVTDFFVGLGLSHEDFAGLLKEAKPSPAPDPRPWRSNADSPWRQRIDALKRKVLIAEVVSRYVALRGAGDYLMGLCPFHDDHTPSLTVYPGTNTFHCYGCGAHGDIITFVREIERLGFAEALDSLERLRPNHEGESRQNA